MAALSDVEEAMVQLIADFLAIGSRYIPGSTVTSALAGGPVRIYRGWPMSNTLNADLKNGTTTVSVFPVAGSTRRTTRYFTDWHTAPAATPTMTAAVSHNVVSFIGAAGKMGQVAAIRVGPPRSGRVYVSRLTSNDTGETVAGRLATLIPGSSASGVALTMPSPVGLSATVVPDASAYAETRRQEQNIWVTIWSPDPGDRDTVARVVDDGFANMTNQWGNLTYEFGMPDGSNACLRYVSSHTDDVPQQANLWRRDLRYMVEYASTIVQTQPVVVALGGSFSFYDDDIIVEFGNQP